MRNIFWNSANKKIRNASPSIGIVFFGVLVGDSGTELSKIDDLNVLETFDGVVGCFGCSPKSRSRVFAV